MANYKRRKPNPKHDSYRGWRIEGIVAKVQRDAVSADDGAIELLPNWDREVPERVMRAPSD